MTDPLRRQHGIITAHIDVSADLTAASGENVDYTADPLRQVYVGVDGDLVLRDLETGTWLTYSVVKGTLLPGAWTGVGGATTATGLIGQR